MDTNQIVDDYLSGAWWTKENSNIDRSVMALNNRISEAVIKNWWLTKVYPEDIRKAYKSRLFHIHNLGHLTTYCVGWNLEDLLEKGFKGQAGRQTSGPAKHFRTALGHVYNFMYTLQGESAGAQAFSGFDTYLAPFIAVDKLDQREVDQCIQEFQFNMNVPTRVGGQQPFTNITLDQKVPDFMLEESAIIGGVKKESVIYGDFQDEMDMLNQAWWKGRIKGDFVGRTQPFPIETLNVTDNFDFEDKLLFEAIALRGSPYIANYRNTDMDPKDFRSMCCRLRINNKELLRRMGGYFAASPLTGSIGVTTMNLPLMAYLSKDESSFMDLLDYSMNLAMDALEIKRDVIEQMTRENLYPYSKVYLEPVFDRFGAYWKNHFSTFGLVGMNEACLNLFGEDISTPSSLKFAINVIRYMRAKVLEYQEMTNNMGNVEATPAEGTSYSLALGDLAAHPDIITAGTRDSPYYTNSSQLPVGLDKPLGFYLEHQQQIQKLYTGGTVFHIWNGDAVPPWRSIARLIDRVSANYELNYFTYSPTTSICPTHGLMSGKHWKCPVCGDTCEVWQRVTGYFSPLHQWNMGKRQEFSERVHFNIAQNPL